MLEIAVDNDNTDSFCHEIVAKSHTEGRLSDASFLVGKGDYDRGLYHVVFRLSNSQAKVNAGTGKT